MSNAKPVPADRPDPTSILKAGYSPLPLPRGKKSKPPAGWTGKDAPMASGPDVQGWIDEGAYGNVAVRLPHGVIGIDVDDYDGKGGGATWADLNSRSGGFPSTVRITAREDGVSGIRLFRLAAGVDEDNLTDALPGVDVIKHGHRYLVGPGSTHPDGGLYVSIDSVDNASLVLPNVKHLPVLGNEHVAVLMNAPSRKVEPEPGTPCAHVSKIVGDAMSDLATGVNRHDHMKGHVLALVRLKEQKHPGVDLMLTTLEGQYLAALAANPRAGETTRDVRQDFARMVKTAERKVTTDPTPDGLKGCEDWTTFGLKPIAPETETPLEVPRLPMEFWQSRESLLKVRDVARSRAAGSDGLLLACLVRVATSLDVAWVLPPVVMSEASTNLFGAIVLGSGGGKSGTKSLAAEVLPLPVPLTEGFSDEPVNNRGTVDEITAGTGEGILDKFGSREGKTWTKGTHHVLVDSDEVDNFLAVSSQGAGTLPILRTAWSGGSLGATVKNTPTRLAAHDYRLGLLLGAQPGRVGELLAGKEVDGGTPQRFLWLTSLVDDDLTMDNKPAFPGRLDWEPWHDTRETMKIEHSRQMIDSHGNEVTRYGVKIAASVVTQIENDHLAQAKSMTGTLDSHRNLLRLKTALALGLLDRGAATPEVTIQDWDLAGMLLNTSDEVRDWLTETAEQASRMEAAKKALARRGGESAADRALRRVASGLVTILLREGPLSKGPLTRAMARRDRGLFDDAIELAMRDGRITKTGIEYDVV